MTVKKKSIDWMLSQQEGLRIEFKQSASDKIGRSICAFANTSGGTIFVGAGPGGKTFGLLDPSDEAAKVENAARQCEPHAEISVTHIKREGKDILQVDVNESTDKPHSFGSAFYIRVGAMNQSMKRDELWEMIRASGKAKFDDQPCRDFNYPKDFDAEAFRLFLIKSKLSPPKNRADMLVNIGLAKYEGKRLILNNAGVLLFAKEPKRFIMGCPVDCILFAGWDKVDILDRKTFEGNFIESIDGAMAFLRKNLKLRYEIKTLQRKEILEIPEEALREALLNAVIHRDYFFHGSYVMVEIYRDRVEIINPGGLAPGLSPKDFGKKTVRRNPLLAETFQRMDEIENAGSGVKRIQNALKGAGLPRARFEFTSFFTAIFKRTGAEDTPQLTPQVTPQVRAQVEAQVKGSKIRQAILKLCVESMRSSELVKALGYKRRYGAFDKAIAFLLKNGLIRYTIPEKPRSKMQKYTITERGKAILEAIK